MPDEPGRVLIIHQEVSFAPVSSCSAAGEWDGTIEKNKIAEA
jgi:hypothetical protein